MALLKITGFKFAHDPVIVKENDSYYRFNTGKGIPMSVSTDLLNWRFENPVFAENPEWSQVSVPKSTDFWAPDVVYRNEKWRIYYSVSTFGKNKSAIGMAETPSLRDCQWEDKGLVIGSEERDDFNAIDPNVCADKSGDDFLVFGSFWGGIQIIGLDKNGFVKRGDKISCIASRKLIPNSIEGGFVYPYQDTYYLFVSHGFCCRGIESTYRIVCGYSKNIVGPYFDFDGRLMTDGGGTILRDGNSFERWAGPGHNSVFTDDGKTYLVYHAYDRMEKGIPNLMVEELKWRDGIPYLD